jgi:pimeloyl-ACP methyl ester carboxylesterase
VACPVSFILGSADQMTPPAAARELATALRADTVVLPAGHSLMGEAPDRLLDAIRRRVPTP